MKLSTLLFVCWARTTVSHAILTTPAPRSGTNTGTGIKLTPFANAATYALECGGTNNNDPGVEQPTVAFSPGDTIDMTWRMTIPHAADVLLDGVRVAVHYGNGDTFADNILAGGVGNDPQAGTVPVAPIDAVRNEDITYQVTLPAGKTCDYCTLQWIWSAQNDGGSYLACADISITTNGQLPNFNNIESEIGKVLPGVGQPLNGGDGGDGGPPPPPPPSTVDIDMPASGTIAQYGITQQNQLKANMANTLGVLQANIALTVTTKDNDSVDLAFTVTVASDAESDNVKSRADNSLNSAAAATQRLGLGLVGLVNFEVEETPDVQQNSGSGGGGGGGGSSAGTVVGVLFALLIVGGIGYWYFKIRPNSSKSASTGKSPPAPTYQAGSGMPPPPPPPAGGAGGLPPGWSEAKDPSSGVTYYYNASTGATQWTPPNHV